MGWFGEVLGGTNLNFTVMSAAVAEFREKATISEEYFEEIRKDVRRRGGRRWLER